MDAKDNSMLAPVFEALKKANSPKSKATASIPTTTDAPTDNLEQTIVGGAFISYDSKVAATAAATATATDNLLSTEDIFADEASTGNINTSTGQTSDNDFLTIAQNYVKEGLWEQAEHYYHILLASFPDASALRAETANVYQQQGKTAAALKILEPWTSVKPQSIEALQALGQALCADNQFEKCEQLLLETLSQGVSSTKVYYWLGEALRQQGKLRAAQTTYLLALRLSPQDMMLRLALITLVSESDPLHKQTSKVYQDAMEACMRGNMDEAVNLIQKALTLSAKNISAADNGRQVSDEGLDSLISAVNLSGDVGPGLSEFLNQSSADTPEKLLLRANVKIEEEAREEAFAMLKQGISDFPDAASLVCAYASLLEQNSISDAINFLAARLKSFSMDFSIFALYGRQLLLNEEYSKALDALRKAYQFNTHDINNNNNLVIACRRTENLNFALEVVQSNINLLGETPDILLLLGTIHSEMDNLIEAGTYFGLVMKKDSEDLRGVMAQALLYTQHQMLRDAILVLQQHINLPAATSNENFLYLYAWLLRNDKQLTDAQHTLQKLLDSFPNHIAGRRAMAELLVTQGSYPESAHHFREIIKTGKYDVKCLADLAEVYEICGEVADAEDLYKQALEKKPKFPKARQNLGFCRLREGDFKQGLDAYEVMSATSPPDFPEVGEIPFWRGESIKGKTLLLYQNCSTSETILFTRYFPYLKKMGARIHLLVKTELVQLLLTNSDICSDKPIPSDFALPISSIPKVFCINIDRIPSADHYLMNDFSLMEPWTRLIGEKRSKKLVGLAWQSDVSMDKRKPYDKISSLDLMMLGEMVNARKHEYVSFQMGDEGRRQEHACSYPIRSSSAFADNWAHIAAGISMMDLVITNDQPVAHIAGAMGIKTLVLIPSVAPWYWFTNRADSPWYNSVELIRQSIIGDWYSSIRKVEEKINSLY